jgi:hypothetical protein
LFPTEAFKKELPQFAIKNVRFLRGKNRFSIRPVQLTLLITVRQKSVQISTPTYTVVCACVPVLHRLCSKADTGTVLFNIQKRTYIKHFLTKKTLKT